MKKDLSKIFACCWLLLLCAPWQVFAALATPYPPSANLSGTTLTLSWGTISGASYYHIGYRDGAGSWNTAGAQYTGSSRTWTGITNLNARSYRIQACNGSVCSAWSGASSPVSSAQRPATPTWISANLNGNDLTVSWQSVASASYYNLQYRDGVSNWNAGGNYANTSRTWLGFTPVQSRSYRIQACNSAGCSGWSVTSNSVTIDPVPAAMTAPLAVVSASNVSLTWTPVAQSDFYQLQYKDGAGSWLTSNQSYTGSTYTWSNLPAVTNRSYRMRACNESGCSSWSAASNAVSIYPTPATPVSVIATVLDGVVTLSWEQVSGTDYYKIEYRNGTGAWNAANGNYQNNTVTWQLTTSLSSRQYRVSSCNPSACSPWSTASNVINLPARMAAPTAVSNSTSIGLSWQAITGAHHYRLQYSDGNAAWKSASTSYSGSTVSWPNSALHVIKDRRYRMRVCSADDVCPAAWSPPSNTISYIPVMNAPAASATGNSISLTWQSLGDLHYQLQYQDGGGQWQPSSAPLTGNSQTWNNVGVVQNRRYRMRACVANGQCSAEWSAPSVPVSTNQATPAVVTFSWAQNKTVVGKTSTFNWQITNVAECFESIDNSSFSKVSATTGSKVSGPFFQSRIMKIRWYCTDLAGGRYPRTPSEFIEANLTINKLSPPSLSTLN
ncbi:fibronectin type III domain-containing protein [Bowmanella denitrificans]|uniref:fibronectin type III domain-containing protein n=1 Tax=Bowmanella denitrificans TaxID=366582 RepID=UPI0011AF17E6|nr:fibronectin type III domain-containing protein [Bowmanella denitrificans]